MITIKPDNVEKHLCIVCDKLINTSSYWECKKCNKICQIIVTSTTESDLTEIKSTCCQDEVDDHQNITCSELCHYRFVKKMLEEFGEYKKITDTNSGKSYKVPTKLIIEEGVRQEQLKNFPLWE